VLYVCKAALLAAAVRSMRMLRWGHKACMANVSNVLENLNESENMKDTIIYEEVLILKFIRFPW
jgi:hypothetical protein